MSCRHNNANHLFPDEPVYVNGDFAGLTVGEQLRCIDCGAWLPLGSSNDDSEAVKLEIRATEIADGQSFTRDEYDGDAGYLARAIVGHEERDDG